MKFKNLETFEKPLDMKIIKAAS